LARALASQGHVAPVQPAFKYTAPTIGEAVREVAARGHDRVVILSDSPHFSAVTTGAYLAEARAAAAEAGVEVVAADDYYVNAHFVAGLVTSTSDALRLLPDPSRVAVLFTAHSLPADMVAAGDPYVDQLRATVSELVERIRPFEWQLAFQSRGMGPGAWLEPTAEAVLENWAKLGVRQVLLVPVGFTTDHVETLYDIDVSIAGQARTLGLRFRRANALNTSDALIAALADAVRPHVV
jgi:ferrochelatase